ncbi:MAG: large conductance mechanosensitive channel protein MscL [Lachnospiraceae bacterium]|nr:large conductance mechanosensitive channel protein MscL [Lachnospiraceae bacterium]
MAELDLKEARKKAYGKGKGFFSEFQKFIMRGSVIDLAVGVIIGAAFQGIVKSLVDDIVMPVISLVTGGVDFTNWFVALDGSHYTTLKAAQEAGAATLNYGTFLTAVINFLLMALVIFILVKFLNRVSDRLRKTPDPEPTTKTCPYCQSEISIKASRCPQCTSQLEVDIDFKP